MKRKGFFLLYMFIASVVFGLTASVLEVKMAYAYQEAGPVNTGYLLDEEFDFLDANGSATNDLKISGWEVETTGGSYSFLYYNNFKVNDNSTTESVTLKKRFVSQTSGKLTLEYRFKMPVLDGVTWQLRSDDVPGFAILTTSGGNLSYQNSSGSPVTLQSYNANQEYGVKVVVDVDTKTANVYIDGILKASGVSFSNNVTKLNYFYFNTGAAAIGDNIYFFPVKIYKGYSVFERFLTTPVNSVPQDWSLNAGGGTGSVNSGFINAMADPYSFQINDTSTSNNVTMSKSFAAQTGITLFEYKFMLPIYMEGSSAELVGGGSSAVKIITSGNNLCYVNASNQIVVIQPFVSNLWYSIKVKVNPVSHSADIYVNGKLKAQNVAINSSVTAFDNIKFSTSAVGTGLMWLDDILVYPFQSLPSDYVPIPSPVTSTDKIIGMQAFPGWREGRHVGWEWLYNYPLHQPYLDWYDEGNPEEVDWEIKWMTEHGVNFVFEDWYAPQNGIQNNIGSPIKDPGLGHWLHDGYFNAQYSNQLKFAINTWNVPANQDDFRKNWVPFWMEYYFKDPRYMKIDNKIVLGINKVSAWTTALGGADNMKLEMKYLRDELVNKGVAAGAYILTDYKGSDPGAVKGEMDTLLGKGLDYGYEYHYGKNVNDIATMQNRMTTQKNSGSAFGVTPTIAIGWNSAPWEIAPDGTNVSLTDFNTLSTWVRDTFMPSLPTGNLGKKLVLYSNWNEYGEGYYLMPAKLAGFQYLDNMRTVFTGVSSHSDIVPTDAQKSRFNVLYPKGWVAHTWNFDGNQDKERWGIPVRISGLNVASGYMTGTITGNDSYITSNDGLKIDITNDKLIKIRLKNNSSGMNARFYFTTNSDTAWNESKKKSFAITPNSEYKEYIVDMSTVAGWNGTLNQLRFDPVDDNVTNGTFGIDYITITNGLLNTSFESPASNTNQYGSTTSGWVFVSNSGVQQNGSVWGAVNAPDGFQTAFIQNTGSFSQSLWFKPGTYSLKFRSAKRSFGSTQTFQVLLDSTVIDSFSLDSTSFSEFTTANFAFSTAGVHTIKFVGTTTDDRTDFIDTISIQSQ
jgi:hypothetical protein